MNTPPHEAPLATFERRAPLPDLVWVLFFLAPAMAYLPALVLVVPLLERTFRGTRFETSAFLSVVVGGTLGWFVIPTCTLWLISSWTRSRYGRFAIFRTRIQAVRPLDMGAVIEIAIRDLRLVDCGDRGVLVETDRYGVTRPTRFLVPCGPDDHPRVLDLLGFGPTTHLRTL